MISMYESSPKVKLGKACVVHSSWIAELKVPSRDRVSISPRSCVDFVRSAQAEIVCLFRRERVSISPDDRLEFVEDRLRFGKSSPRWRIVGREEIEGWKKVAQRSEDKGARRRIAAGQISSRSTARSIGGEGRSTARSTGVYNLSLIHI